MDPVNPGWAFPKMHKSEWVNNKSHRGEKKKKKKNIKADFML